MAKGRKTGGRQKGSLNKKTVAKIIERSESVGEIRRLGKKTATQVLDELMATSYSEAAYYQQEVIKGRTGQKPADPNDLEMFFRAVDQTTSIAKELAPFQQPKLRAIIVPGTPGTEPPPAPAIQDDGKTIDDPAALMRFYQQNIKRIGV